MIKESIQHTMRLIQDINEVNPDKYKEQRIELEQLIQKMKVIIERFDKATSS